VINWRSGSKKNQFLTSLMNNMLGKNQSIPCYRLVMPKETSPMTMIHTGNTSSLRWQEVGRRQGPEEVVVIWAYSVALVRAEAGFFDLWVNVL
jgi:hypothetical protein